MWYKNEAMTERIRPEIKQGGELVLRTQRPRLIATRGALLALAWYIQPDMDIDSLKALEDTDKDHLSHLASQVRGEYLQLYLQLVGVEADISQQIVSAKICQDPKFTDPKFDFSQVNLYNRDAEENAVKDAVEYGSTLGIPPKLSENFMREVRIPRSKIVQDQHKIYLNNLTKANKQKIKEAEMLKERDLSVAEGIKRLTWMRDRSINTPPQSDEQAS